VLLGSRGLFSSVKDTGPLTAKPLAVMRGREAAQLRALNAAAARMEPEPPLLAMTAISKSFSGVPVLREVAFDLQPARCTCSPARTDAGKSTLMKIAAGVHTDYQGDIALLGLPTRFASPQEAAVRGISVIHQEMSLIDSMSVADNMFLGRS